MSPLVRTAWLLLIFAGSSYASAKDGTTIAPHLRAHPLARMQAGPTDTRFVAIPAGETGVDFVNRLDWNHPQGLLFDTGYACGGIAVGDLDGNGLPDLFFVSALGRNRLYFQESPWEFVERGRESGLAGNDGQSLGGDGWGTGAAIFDIDNDGDLDLYVCNYDAANTLYINRGEGEFDERAADYGLDTVDACLMPSVADYDCDGDLDIFLAVNRYLEAKQFTYRDLFYWQDGMEYLRPAAKQYFTIRRHFDKAEQLNMWAGRSNRLLRNEGPGQKFTDLSEQMGATRGDTLSATWWDYDHDGWPDLYVCNDLAAPDQLFHNRGDGTFTDVTLRSLPHTPWFAMGSSAGDVDNDGLVDMLVADMSFRTHYKDKALMGDMTGKFRNVDYFPHDQLMRNALFVNSGTEHFQEAAYLAGLASTDWTWTAKLADLNNNGRLDAYLTNGSPVNLTRTGEPAPGVEDSVVFDTTHLREHYSKLPPVLEQNLVYENAGDLQFVDRSAAWGLDDVGMSFAAVHADLDRDGDLDLVVANLDRPPLLYRNDTENVGVLVELQGGQSNRQGIGAELTIETREGKQVRQVYPVAGFLSCQEAVTHFGIGQDKHISRFTVHWPSGVEQEFENLRGGKLYRISEPEVPHVSPRVEAAAEPLFESVTDAIVVEHHEEPYDDFARQPLLPNKLSQLGPPMAWGDIDGDGDDDFFLGEGTDWMGVVYLNNCTRGGKLEFEALPQAALARDAAAEDSATLFVDANADGNLDLYVASGSVECEPGDECLRDRLYFGDGSGEFEKAPENWLPDLRISTGALAASDFDQDGDMDVFVGGRSIPGAYPLTPAHAFLRNEGDHFRDALTEVAPQLVQAGMITDAVWADVDGDQWDDLLVATDWGPLRLYLNKAGKLVEATESAGLSQWTGWWQSLACSDLDNDGDMDMVAGNFGLNTKYKASQSKPVLAFYGHYSDPGGDSEQQNLIEASYENEHLFPMRGKSCSSAAMPHLAKRFPTYEKFARATLAEIYTPQCLQKAKRFEVNTLATACFLNDGTGHFERVLLPRAVQLAPVFAIAVTEVNGDDIPDLFLAQNFFTPQKETGPMDGGLGVIAIGRGDGTFESMQTAKSGVVVPEDAKAAAAVDLDGDGLRDLCVATNNGPLRLFRQRGSLPSAPSRSKSVAPTAWSHRNLKFARQFLESGQFEDSLPYLRRALKVNLENSEALLMLAAVRREQARYSEAQRLLERVQESNGVEKSIVLAEKGRLLHKMKQRDLAVERLRESLALDPRGVVTHWYLGEILMEQGKLRPARQHLQKANRGDLMHKLEQQADVAEILYKQGKKTQSEGDDAQAVRFFEQSRRLDALPRTLRELAKILESTAEAELRDPWLAEQLRRQLAKPQP